MRFWLYSGSYMSTTTHSQLLSLTGSVPVAYLSGFGHTVSRQSIVRDGFFHRTMESLTYAFHVLKLPNFSWCTCAFSCCTCHNVPIHMCYTLGVNHRMVSSTVYLSFCTFVISSQDCNQTYDPDIHQLYCHTYADP